MNNKQGMISASMMCADLLHIKETIRLFEEEKVEYLHIDVMDGAFVPNLGLGTDYIRALRSMTQIPMDLHLMAEHPEDKYSWLGIQPSDIVSVHYESTIHVQRALAWLRPYGCTILLAINPATPVCFIEEVLDYIDGINVLMVNPGFAGQQILPNCINKAERIAALLKERGRSDLLMEVDGNISPANAKILRSYGADLFVGGSSSVFSKKNDMRTNIAELRAAIV